MLELDETSRNYLIISGILAVIVLITVVIALIPRKEKAGLIHDAVITGNMLKTKILLNQQPKLANATGYYDDAPLHWATNGEISELLILKGARINAKDRYGRTPLHYSVVTGRRDVAEILISHGAEINARDSGGVSPLHLVDQSGSKGMKTQFLSSPALSRGGNTPLHIAAAIGEKTILELLLTNNADINSRNEENKTPLHCAIENGQEGIVAVLTDRGAIV